uniref:hypothetical protein n=1 Tax=Paenibacillus terrae TaxID=159743 RepID=UPI00119DB68B|nr:hypothetical protein [Paenibacillus terrae]
MIKGKIKYIIATIKSWADMVSLGAMKVKDALTQQEKVEPTQRLRPKVGFVPARLDGNKPSKPIIAFLF